jgi:long-chain acyl-CoA synthetase
MSGARTLPELFLDRVATSPDATAWWHRVDGAWCAVTWAAFAERVRAVADGLRARGVDPGERVGLLAPTRLAWIEADVAAMCAGAAVTAIHAACTTEEVRYILNDAGVATVFVDGPEQLAKVQAAWPALPALRQVVVFDGGPSDDPRILSYEALIDEGRAAGARDPAAFEALARRVAPDDLATLIYTSGTTGQPKGVMLPHAAWMATLAGVDAVLRPSLQGDDAQYLFLPLSHSFGKVLALVAVQLGVPTAVDGDLGHVVDGLREIRPTVCGAVPRVFEKVHAKVLSQARDRGVVAYTALRWASSVGAEAVEHRLAGRPLPPLLRLRFGAARRLVFDRIREGFGGRMRCFISGGAPLAPELARFFYAADLLVLEGYGMTESCAASVSNRLDDFRFGSVGKPFPGFEARIADDGEILLRGPGVMRGYHGLPEATAEVIDADGWLHTGDLGHVDDDGFLYVTGRKKELIITAGGKNIGPARFEGLLKVRSRFVSQVVMHGDKRPYCVALVTLDPDGARTLASEIGRPGAPADDPAVLAAARDRIGATIAEINRELPSYETVKDFAILPRDLTVEDGDLTPSLKVRRRIVEDKHRAVLDALYRAR